MIPAETIRPTPIWAHSAFPALVLVTISMGLALVLNPGLLSPFGLIGWSASQIGLWIAVLAQAMVIIGRSIDLSVGAAISLLNVVAVTLAGLGCSTLAVIALVLLAGLAVGTVNGLLVGYLRLNPLLATFSMSFVLLGLALQIQPAPGGSVAFEAVAVMNGATWGCPNALVALGLMLLLWRVLTASRFMLLLRAVGSDPARAFNSGVPVGRVRAQAFAIAGIINAVAALCLTYAVGSGDPLLAQPYTLLTIAGAIIGGVSLAGGEGTGPGAVLGVMFIGIAAELALGAGVSPFYQQSIVGLILLLGLVGVVLFGNWTRRLRREAIIRKLQLSQKAA
ncbi:ABC transporter permease [Paracoccus kondratievae]|uniref:ABC transporter permease n=1 Tax=Paracoccus kondratievae TaxID=135740 RepID=UPI00126638D7|nr:ABC transporter permease [Paracoccus kondratievae]QFQ86678.1 ABC transporter permease [Paracoccus kondratievae]